MKLRAPDKVEIFLEKETVSNDTDRARVSFELDKTLKILLEARDGVKTIRLRWNEKIRDGVRVLGDAWERGYGDLEWRGIVPERVMPWYCLVSNGSDLNTDYTGRFTEGFGVKVLPNAFAFWQVDGFGVTLLLDVRNGTRAFAPSGVLECAEVVFCEYRDVSAFMATKAFCNELSPTPYLADHVVYGSNNWYYAYGKSSHEEILGDARFVKEMCRENENIPYMVIDDGWQPNSCDAPWDRGNERFPDMKRLAEEMKALGVRPGIWVRYLVNGRDDEPRKVDTFPEEYYLERCNKVLDPSHPEVLKYVETTTKRIADWGYQLIKHDFSTFDIFGKWGFDMMGFPATGDWGFYDKTKTTAQIIKNFYKCIKDSSNGAVIIGCNVIGHLCAGLHQLNRTGDDTSGFEWQRTVKMGVNTLAFRVAQNNALFGADADCVGITGAISWDKNRQWLRVLSASASSLFVSCKLGTLNESELSELREAFKIASVQRDEFIPLDWMETVSPTKFLINGKIERFNWSVDN
jgi:alpha-galactosidase